MKNKESFIERRPILFFFICFVLVFVIPVSCLKINNETDTWLEENGYPANQITEDNRE